MARSLVFGKAALTNVPITANVRCLGKATMIRFYFHPTPNPAKIALFLEDAELPYETIPIDTKRASNTRLNSAPSIPMAKYQRSSIQTDRAARKRVSSIRRRS